MNANWMQFLPQRVKESPLTLLKIPGSHDSGSFTLSDSRHHYLSRNFLLNKVALTPCTRKVVEAWTICQTANFYQQLENGIRYFDLRVSFDENEFWLAHTFYTTKLVEQLQSVASFLQKHRGEIVIIQIKPDWNNQKTITPLAKEQLVHTVMQIFQDNLYESKNKTALDDSISLASLIKADKRVIICIDGVKDTPIWSSSIIDLPWDNTANVSKKEKALTNRLDHMQKDPTKLQGLFWTLTPQTTTVINDVLSRIFTPKKKHSSVDRLAQTINSYFSSVANKMAAAFQNVSVIAIDFPTNELIREVIELNYSTTLSNRLGTKITFLGSPSK